MAMSDAIGFLSQCRTSPEFRKRLYADGEGAAGFDSRVSGTGYSFSYAEMDDALRVLQLRARDEFESGEIRELGQWLSFMRAEEGAVEPCSPSKCGSCSLCG